MSKQEDLIWNLKKDIDQMYEYEDDAQYIRDNLDDWEKQEFESEEYAEQYAESLDSDAHQIWHVIDCDLQKLSKMLDRKITVEDFTDGEFSS